MDALILAAGSGYRFKYNSHKKPKCLLEIKGKTIIFFLIKQLLNSNIRRIYIVLGYKKKYILSYLKKNFPKNKKITFIINTKFKSEGNLYSVLLARKYIKKSFLLLNADIILPKNLIKKLLRKEKKNMFLANPLKFYDKDDIRFKFDSKNIAKEVFVKKNKAKKINTASSGGVAKFSRQSAKMLFAELKKNLAFKKVYYEDAYNQLIKKFKFYVFLSRYKILEIDKKLEYFSAKNILQKNKNYG